MVIERETERETAIGIADTIYVRNDNNSSDIDILE